MSYDEFELKNKEDWKKIHQDIFGKNIPSHAEWTKIDDIIDVLNIIGEVEASNHMFYPDSGGNDLLGASISNEDGCIELHTGVPYIVRPKRLSFEHIDDELDWNYFRIETESLLPSGVYKKYGDLMMEELLELSPLQYVSRSYEDAGEYNGEPLPSTARTVIRYFRGDLVIFKKTSIYNNNPSTYDGRHEKLGVQGFKEHIIAASSKFKLR